MTCIIVDDEINAIKSLRWDIENFISDLEVLGEFSSSSKAAKFIEDNPEYIDIVFLDINMPEMNGFEFIEKVRGVADFEVIFTTAYLNFAFKAIKAEALDYLLKPIDPDELKTAVGKVYKRLYKGNKKNLLAAKSNDVLNTKIKLMSSRELLFISPDNIIYFKSDGNYCTIYFEEGKKTMICKKLKEIERELDENLFFRIHKSYTINLNKITSYIISSSTVMLNNKYEIPVSRTKKNDFLKLIEKVL